ncbi:hypothetical protein ElyMa_002379200 [Elysia marginata]|uniref:Uncharacterized protein n=1 Tax=Elysia marginata TaxID=1093978 RepID=A0AAV4GBL6_9GAST|nr:hypothetical protein ElyMa_002379200 [Elysia marginata]
MLQQQAASKVIGNLIFFLEGGSPRRSIDLHLVTQVAPTARGRAAHTSPGTGTLDLAPDLVYTIIHAHAPCTPTHSNATAAAVSRGRTLSSINNEATTTKMSFLAV